MKVIGAIVVGAGPYGLSVGAHLASRGMDHRVIGEPMTFWSDIAAAAPGRFLKSFCFGTSLSTPLAGAEFERWSADRGLEAFEPCSMSDFAAYGRWFQPRYAPHCDPGSVVNVERRGGTFLVSLSSGETLQAKAVIIATGLSSFAYVPPVLAQARERVTHSAEIKKFSVYRGKRVAVVGGGQSALEAAALLRESGANPEVIAREPETRWMSRLPQTRSLWQQMRFPISGLGAGPKALLLARLPQVCRYLPDRTRRSFNRHHLPPEGAWWLRERVEGVVPISLGSSIRSSAAHPDGVCLDVEDQHGSTRRELFDFVIAATGYRVDVDNLTFLSPAIRRTLAREERAPRLTKNFESSEHGLFFAGPVSAASFGPLFRFVVGAQYTARTLSDRLAQN